MVEGVENVEGFGEKTGIDIRTRFCILITMIVLLMYIFAAAIFLISAFGFYSMYDGEMYAMYFPYVDPNLFWTSLLISIIFCVLGRILSQLNTIEKCLDQTNVVQIKAKKDLGNWPPSV
jgi:hypothetical protein